MMYAVLYNPGHNRVYYEASLKLSASEFNIAAQKLSVMVEDVQHINIQGIDYLAFRTGSELTLQDIRIISGLSFACFVRSETDRRRDISQADKR